MRSRLSGTLMRPLPSNPAALATATYTLFMKAMAFETRICMRGGTVQHWAQPIAPHGVRTERDGAGTRSKVCGRTQQPHLLLLAGIHVALAAHDQLCALHGAIAPDLRVIAIITDDLQSRQAQMEGDAPTVSPMVARSSTSHRCRVASCTADAFARQTQPIIGDACMEMAAT